jgi:hypothetical protein
LFNDGFVSSVLFLVSRFPLFVFLSLIVFLFALRLRCCACGCFWYWHHRICISVRKFMSIFSFCSCPKDVCFHSHVLFLVQFFVYVFIRW